MSVIILTGHGTIPRRCRPPNAAPSAIWSSRSSKEELLGQVNARPRRSSFMRDRGDWRAKFVSRSQLMEDRLRIANRAAGSDVPVLLTGDNGTGKELLARAIHAASARRAAPFVVVSCRKHASCRCDAGRAVRRGAEETGNAESVKEGALQRARGGTLLLDEIAELPQGYPGRAGQGDCAKDRCSVESEPAAVRADVRLICTTSRDLKALTESGAFFTDLTTTDQYTADRDSALGPAPRGHSAAGIAFSGAGHRAGRRQENLLPQGHRTAGDHGLAGKRAPAIRPGEAEYRPLARRGHDRIGTESSDSGADTDIQRSARSIFARLPRRESAANRGQRHQAARLAKRSRTDFYKLLARYRLHVDDFKKANSETDTDDKNEYFAAT